MGQGHDPYRFSAKSDIQHGRNGEIFEKSAASLCSLYSKQLLTNCFIILRVPLMGQGQDPYRFSAKSEIQHGRHGAIFEKPASSLWALYKVQILANSIFCLSAIGQGHHGYGFWHRSKIQDGRHFSEKFFRKVRKKKKRHFSEKKSFLREKGEKLRKKKKRHFSERKSFLREKVEKLRKKKKPHFS
jgi:hypothetical protein